MPRGPDETRSSRVFRRVVWQLAARQDGLVTTRQLLDCGHSDDQIRHWQDAGRIHRVHRGVYALGHPGLSLRAERRAALLALGSGAALTHLTAAHLHGLIRRPPDLVDVAPVRSVRPRHGLRVRDVRVPERDLTEVDGLRCTTVARTLVDLAGEVDPAELEQVCRQAEYRKALDIPQVLAALDRAGPVTGGPALRRILAAESRRPTNTDSHLEATALTALRAAGVPEPVLQQRFRLPALGVIRVDMWWPDRRLVVEVDGPHHERPLQAAHDRRRDAGLRELGVTVLRLKAAEIDRDPVAAATRVSAALS